VTGGPGSGKDIVIREAIAESKIVELNFVQARDYLSDKQKLSEKTSDFRRESIRRRGPLIINGPADDFEKLSYIKEELEELGYDTMMIFVNTTNEVSKERNSALSRMMVESVRYDKWMKCQENTKYFRESFVDFIGFDNTGDIDTKEEDITEVYQFTKQFLDTGNISDIASDWKNRNISLFKEEKNVKSTNRFYKIKTTQVERKQTRRQLQLPHLHRSPKASPQNLASPQRNQFLQGQRKSKQKTVYRHTVGKPKN